MKPTPPPSANSKLNVGALAGAALANAPYLTPSRVLLSHQNPLFVMRDK